MGCHTKVSIVLNLPELIYKDVNEKFYFFFNVLGEPKYRSEYTIGLIDYFQYEGNIQVIWDWDGDIPKFGVEKIIFDQDVESGNKKEVNLTIEDINNHVESLAKMFGKKPKNCQLRSKTWNW
jgi:hypothetical protein